MPDDKQTKYFLSESGIPEHWYNVNPALEALTTKEKGEEKTIVFNLCGHGHFDLSAYEDFRAGELEAFALPEEIEESRAAVPSVE